MAGPDHTPAASLAAMLALAACQTLAPVPADPQIASLANTIQLRANTFYSALAAEAAPDCGFDAHLQDHADFAALAERLQEQVATNPGKLLRRAADALTRTIANARESHRLASAVTTDPAGPCLAPGALKLNRDAIARASAAIAASQESRP